MTRRSGDTSKVSNRECYQPTRLRLSSADRSSIPIPAFRLANLLTTKYHHNTRHLAKPAPVSVVASPLTLHEQSQRRNQQTHHASSIHQGQTGEPPLLLCRFRDCGRGRGRDQGSQRKSDSCRKASSAESRQSSCGYPADVHARLMDWTQQVGMACNLHVLCVATAPASSIFSAEPPRTPFSTSTTRWP